MMGHLKTHNVFKDTVAIYYSGGKPINAAAVEVSSSSGGGGGGSSSGGGGGGSSTTPKIARWFPPRMSQAEQAWLNVAQVLFINIQDLQPLCTTERSGQRNFYAELNSRYHASSSTWAVKVLEEIDALRKERQRDELVEFIQHSPYGKIAGATDVWTSVKAEAFAGFVDAFVWPPGHPREFERVIRTSSCRSFPGSHTAEAQRELVSKLVTELKIPGYTKLDDLYHGIAHNEAAPTVAAFRDETGALVGTKGACHFLQLTPGHVLKSKKKKDGTHHPEYDAYGACLVETASVSSAPHPC
jgi:hypothetical protein